MEILTVESCNIEDTSEEIEYDEDNVSYDTDIKIQPGIPTIKSFNEFGKKIFNRFLYTNYLKSDIFKDNGSLTEYINSVKEYKEICNDTESYAMIGGYFVCVRKIINRIIRKTS